MRTTYLLSICLVLSSFVNTNVNAEDYTRWGERWTRNLAIPGLKNLPETFKPVKRNYQTGKTTLPENSGVKWTATLGNVTCTSPIVCNGKIFIGTNNGNPYDERIRVDYGILLCFDEKTGEFLWQLAVPKLIEIRWSDWYHMGICSTPTAEDDRVYLVTNRCEVVCLDANGMANGNDGPYKEEGKHCVPAGDEPLTPGDKDADIIWIYDLHKELKVEPHNATSSSVIIDGDLLYVATSNGVEHTHNFVKHPEAPSMIVLNKKTGKLIARDDFKIDGTVTHGQWSSPAMATVDGKKRVFYGAGNGCVYATDALPVSAAERKEKKPQLLPAVWKVHGHPLAQEMDEPPVDHQHDSTSYQITANPVYNDGSLYVIFTQEPFHGMRKGYLACLDPTGTGNKTKSAFKWRCDIGSSVSTPAVTKDGLLFVTNFWGVLYCIDAKTGKIHWQQQLNGRKIWGSPLVADGKVYIGTDRNFFYVIEAKKEFKMISEIRMGTDVHTTPSVANGVLYVPTGGVLYAVEK